METKEDSNDFYNRIPDEIMAKIFSYLPPTALQQARLVCSKWYEASKDFTIAKNLHFVFSGSIYNENKMKKFFKTVEKGRFACYNLKFRHAELRDTFEKFISSHGAKIFSLSFRNCSFTFKTIEKIMINCTNLRKLGFSGANCDLGDDLKIAEENGQKIVREKLEKLIFDNCNWLSNDVLSIFLVVYSSTKDLKLLPSQGRDTSKFLGIVDQNCAKIKKLTTNVEIDDTRDNGISALSSLWRRLTKLKVPTFASYNGTKSFVTQYRNITSLSLYVCRHIDVELFEHILHHNSNLEHLCIQMHHRNGRITQSKNILELLAKSRLKTLNCTMFVAGYNCQPEEFTCDVSLVNHTLERLSFNSTNGTNAFSGYFFLQMLKMFQNLTYLDLSIIINDQYQEDITSYIFECMVNLKVLKLWIAKPFGIGPPSRSIINDSSFDKCQPFPNLEHLALKNCDGLTDGVIEKFSNFPNLKILNLNNCYNMTECGVLRIPTVLPILESLDIMDIPVTKGSILQTCQNLKFLSFLGAGQSVCSFVKQQVFNDSVVENLAFRCPTLRIVKLRTASACDKLYVYNHLRKKMINDRNSI